MGLDYEKQRTDTISSPDKRYWLTCLQQNIEVISLNDAGYKE